MPWAASPTLGQQSPAAFGLSPALVPLFVDVSTADICEGGRAVLTASGGYYSGNTVKYAWTPNADITATAGSWRFGPQAVRVLVFHDLLSGQEASRVVLPNITGACMADVQGWRPGLYVATLLVDGKSCQHQRFAVGN